MLDFFFSFLNSDKKKQNSTLTLKTKLMVLFLIPISDLFVAKGQLQTIFSVLNQVPRREDVPCA
jgi:hypothetical protein